MAEHFVYFLLVLNAKYSGTVGVVEETLLHISSTKLSQAEAVSYCHNLNKDNRTWHVAIDDSQEKHRDLQNKLQDEDGSIKKDLPTAWIEPKRIKYASLYTSAGNEFSGLVTKHRYSCGYLDTRTGLIQEAANCAVKDAMASVCKMNACSRCPPGEFPRHCLQKKNTCYVFHGSNNPNWYSSRARCVLQGGQLVGPDQRNKARLVRYKAMLYSSNVWVDLTNQEWLIGKHKRIDAVFWDDNEPHPQGDCAIIATANDKGPAIWRTAECYEQHHVICQTSLPNKGKRKPSKPTPSSTPHTPPENCSQSGVVMVYLICGWLLVLLQMAIIVSIVIHHTKKIKESIQYLRFGNTDTAATEEGSPEEQNNLNNMQVKDKKTTHS